jgi:hypothetical protein
MSPLVGEWTGVYGNDTYGLSFVVDAAGMLRDFTLTTSAGPPCGDSEPAEVVEAGPIAIVNDAFMVEIPIRVPQNCGDDGACFGGELAGTFTPVGKAEGTWKKAMLNQFTACVGVSSGSSWRAAKDCSARPKEGASFERFCP